DIVRFYVDDADAQLKLGIEFLEQVQIFAAAARELQRQLLDVGFHDGREEITIAAFPGRLPVAVAVADVHGDLGIHAFDHGVQHLDAPGEIFGETGIIGLIDLDVACAGLYQRLHFQVHHATDVHGKSLFAGVILIANALDQAVGAGEADLGAAFGEGLQELEIGHQPKRCHGELALHHAVVEVVVKLFRRAVNLDAGQTLDEIIDHVVAARLAVGDDVETCDFLVLDGSFSGGIVDLVQIVAADAAGEILGLQALEPARHGIAADHGYRECWIHGRITRAVSCRGRMYVILFDSGRGRSGRHNLLFRLPLSVKHRLPNSAANHPVSRARKSPAG